VFQSNHCTTQCTIWWRITMPYLKEDFYDAVVNYVCDNLVDDLKDIMIPDCFSIYLNIYLTIKPVFELVCYCQSLFDTIKRVFAVATQFALFRSSKPLGELWTGDNVRLFMCLNVHSVKVFIWESLTAFIGWFSKYQTKHECHWS
jgi:hypothetical protein